MSYSNRKEYAVNPATKKIEWNGAEGFFYIYHKEDKTRYTLDKIRFVVLDQLSTVRGFNEPTDAGIYANEIMKIKEDNLIVKTSKGEHIASGIYGTIKDTIIAKGGKFCSVIYCILINEEVNEFELARIELVGSAFSAWIDKLKELKETNTSVHDAVFVWSGGSTAHKKGVVNFKKPVIVIDDITEVPADLDANAIKFDKELQEFFKQRNGSGPEISEEEIDKKEIPVERTNTQAEKEFYDDLPQELKDEIDAVNGPR